MKKSHYVLVVVLLGVSFILSACVPGPRVVGIPGISFSDERVFVAYGNFVYGLDVDNGSIIWHFPEEADNQVVFYARPLVTNNAVYVGDLANNFHKLDKETGTIQWRFSESKGFFIGQAAKENGIVYVPSNDGSLYALDDTDGSLLWAFTTGHYIWAQPLVTEDIIYVGSMDHSIYAISKNGEALWSKEMAGAVVSAPVLSQDGNVLFAGSIGKHFVAMDSASGEEIWSFEAEDSIWGVSLLVDSTIYFADSGGNLYALDSDSGENLWRVGFAGSVIGGLAEIPDGMVLATGNGVMRAYDFDGKPLWESTLTGEIFQAPAVHDEYIFVGTIEGDNLVYGFNLSGVQLWSTTPEK